MFNQTFDFGVGSSVDAFWARQDPALLDAAATVIVAHDANPWVFAADERHFDQFAGAAEKAAFAAMPLTALRALLGHWWGQELGMSKTITYVMERLGTEATSTDAELVLELAEQLAAEQGDEEFDAINWLSNRTYDWTELWEAANGSVAALAKVRAEAGLPVLS